MRFLGETNPLRLKFPGSEKVSSIIFYICFGIYLFCNAYRTTTLQYTNKELNQLLLKVSWLCVYISIANILFLCDYSIKQLLCQMAILCVFYVSYYISRYYCLFQGFVIVFSARYINWRKFVIVNTGLYISLLLSVIVCYSLGYLISLNYFRNDAIRIDMGFSHPNEYGAYLMEICIAWMVMRFDVLKLYDYAFFVVVAAYAWIGPNSRTSALIIMCMVILLPFVKHGDKWINHKIGRLLFSLCYPAGFVFSLVCASLYDAENKVFLFINRVLSGRIGLANEFMQNYAPTLLGQHIKIVNSAKAISKGIPAAILDNAYVHLYLRLGILSAFLFMIIIFLAVYQTICKKYYNFTLALCLFSVYGLSENRIDKIIYNFALLTIVLLFQEKEQMDI